MQENQIYNLQPSNVFFSHDRISHRFRNGMYLGDAIEATQCGNLSAKAFPALDAVQIDGTVVAIGGNRRLFVHRICASRGVLQTVRVKLHPITAPVMQKL